ncbi:MAG TPA: FAD-dependent oxidoreductase [Vicinamibacterales bacterium]|nr:FAD-dependent oxidoreductase [Vicinamibacterales bacterium]
MSTKPVILAVDDDRDVLAAVERDLRARYRSAYRILAANSSREALDTVQELKRRNAPVALFLVDQRMPGMTGTEFLIEALKLYPETLRVLLTAYADTSAAISAINDIGLNHYLMKPWDPPEERLYPVLDDLLKSWLARVRLPYEGVRVAGSRWSPQSYQVRDFLSRNQIPYQWIDLDEDAPTRELVIGTAGDLTRLPVVLFPDGSALIAPTVSQLAEKVGLQTAATRPFYDVVIVGAGPSGLASAVYGASEGLRVLLIEQDAPGGQAGTSSMIENYLGFPSGVTGSDLAQRAAAQARRFGAELLVGHPVVGYRRDDPYRIVQLANGKEVSCHALILATGLAVRELNVTGVNGLLGAGVYYGAAMTEAALYRGQDVCMVGGANSAGQGALFFSRYASKVTMLVRAGDLGAAMSQYLVDRIHATKNIEVLTRVELTAVCGNRHLESVNLRHIDSGNQTALAAAALFIFIGVAPRTAGLENFVRMDDKGFIVTGSEVKALKDDWLLERDPLLFETSVPGVFAVGDVRAGANRRIAAAVGEGSAAIFSVHQYLRTV